MALFLENDPPQPSDAACASVNWTTTSHSIQSWELYAGCITQTRVAYMLQKRRYPHL